MAIERNRDGKSCIPFSGGVDSGMPALRHGPWFEDKEAIAAFLDGIENLHCGIDLFTQDPYQLPH